MILYDPRLSNFFIKIRKTPSFLYTVFKVIVNKIYNIKVNQYYTELYI